MNAVKESLWPKQTIKFVDMRHICHFCAKQIHLGLYFLKITQKMTLSKNVENKLKREADKLPHLNVSKKRGN